MEGTSSHSVAESARRGKREEVLQNMETMATEEFLKLHGDKTTAEFILKICESEKTRILLACEEEIANCKEALMSSLQTESSGVRS